MRKLLILASVCTTFFLTGCVNFMQPATQSLPEVLKENPEKAAIAIIYDQFFPSGGLVGLACYNEEMKDYRFMTGMLTGHSHVTLVEPGRYIVVPTSETLRYATVEVEAGKIYGLEVSPLIGWMNPRIDLDKREMDAKFVKEFKKLNPVVGNEQGENGFREMLVNKVHKLQTKGTRTQNTLEATDGLPFNEFLSLFNASPIK